MTDHLPSKEIGRKLESDLYHARRRVNEVFNNGWAADAVIELVRAHVALQNFKQHGGASQPPGDEHVG